MTLADQLPFLQRLAEDSLHLWDIPEGAMVTLINVSENTTYLVEAPGYKAVLRLHRAGYHSIEAIRSELSWIDALRRDTDIETPQAYLGRNGVTVQQAAAPGLETPRHMVLFDFIDGQAPSELENPGAHFTELGAMAATCHNHAETWQPPSGFQRFSWDIDAVFGPNPIWGHWQDAPGVTAQHNGLLQRVEVQTRTRLKAFGRAPNRYGLIHADMRLANLLISPTATRLIDFDDCGFGWFLYDFAAAISFIEDDPNVPDMKAAWLDGYRRVRALSAEEEAEMDTFVMLRRLALLAWIGSHIEAPEPIAMAPDFADRTANLGEAWLART
ncbi:MAG: phosphotransferase [Pseudomonadota bacterium]